MIKKKEIKGEKYTSLTKKKCIEWIQVGQYSKHNGHTMWDHIISWYGKHCKLCFEFYQGSMCFVFLLG
jgi:hypothetical protein